MSKEQRQDRASNRRRAVGASGERAFALGKPVPLPPHPEGLGPRLWPVLAVVGTVVLSAWSLPAAFLVMGVILAYAIATRNDRRNTLLWAYIQGRRQFMQGDYEAALTNFQDMEDADFAPPAVLRGIGLCSYELGRWAEAATYLEDVPDRTPEENTALGHALLELGEIRAAAEVLDGLDEPPPLARVVRAVAALKLGDPAGAVRRLRAVLEEAGGEAAPAEEPYLGARYWLGLAARQAGDEATAVGVLEELYRLDPGYHDVAALVEGAGRRSPES